MVPKATVRHLRDQCLHNMSVRDSEFGRFNPPVFRVEGVIEPSHPSVVGETLTCLRGSGGAGPHEPTYILQGVFLSIRKCFGLRIGPHGSREYRSILETIKRLRWARPDLLLLEAL